MNCNKWDQLNKCLNAKGKNERMLILLDLDLRLLK